MKMVVVLIAMFFSGLVHADLPQSFKVQCSEKYSKQTVPMINWMSAPEYGFANEGELKLEGDPLADHYSLNVYLDRATRLITSIVAGAFDAQGFALYNVIAKSPGGSETLSVTFTSSNPLNGHAGVDYEFTCTVIR